MESVSTKYNFWPKIDGEKWSRKIHFEIPQCVKMVIPITAFVILDTFMKKGKIVMVEFQKYFFFNIIFRPKIVFLGTESILRVKMMHESVK